jgi:hypothetical protein
MLSGWSHAGRRAASDTGRHNRRSGWQTLRHFAASHPPAQRCTSERHDRGRRRSRALAQTIAGCLPPMLRGWPTAIPACSGSAWMSKHMKLKADIVVAVRCGWPMRLSGARAHLRLRSGVDERRCRGSPLPGSVSRSNCQDRLAASTCAASHSGRPGPAFPSRHRVTHPAG